MNNIDFIDQGLDVLYLWKDKPKILRYILDQNIIIGALTFLKSDPT